MVDLGLLKSGKVELQSTIDRGNLMKFLGMRCNEFALIMNTLLDGNAQSVKYGEIIHDGSVKPVSENFQEQAYFENFVVGSDATEFVNSLSSGSMKQIPRNFRALSS